MSMCLWAAQAHMYALLCALICVLSSVLSSVCSPVCALLCVLSCVCSHVFAFICVLPYVCSDMSLPPLVSSPFAPPALFGLCSIPRGWSAGKRNKKNPTRKSFVYIFRFGSREVSESLQSAMAMQSCQRCHHPSARSAKAVQSQILKKLARDPGLCKKLFYN